MQERIEVDSDICEYCEYFCSEPKKCVECKIHKNINNFRGIECIKLTDEKEKNIELKELIIELMNLTKQELIVFIIDNKITEDIKKYIAMRKLIIELIKLTKEELIVFIIENEITNGIKEYVTMRKEINTKKEGKIKCYTKKWNKN